MPRTKLSPTNSTSATATLNDLTLPYPTPSASPLLSSSNSPLSALASPLVLKTPNQQHVRDSTLSLPVGTTFSIPRKGTSGRIGSSILGQLLASHKPGRDQHNLSEDATLSLETIRPKEQQRRSILPMNWTLGFQKTSNIQSLAPVPTQTPRQPSKGKMVQGSTMNSNQSAIENLDQDDEPTSRSEWLESVLSQLSRSESNTLSHYVTLPRVDLQYKQQPSLNSAFLELDRQPKVYGNEKRSKSPKPKQTLQPPTKSLTRKGSACQLALGSDAHGLFQQNRPKTLSSAVILSSIVSVKEAQRNSELLSPNPDAPKDPLNKLSDKAEAVDSSTMLSDTTNLTGSSTTFTTSTTTTTTTTPATTTTRTKGRFTIESSSPAPSVARTRTLSCNATTSLIAQQSSFNAQPPSFVEKTSVVSHERLMPPKPPSSPTRSFSLPAPSPTSHGPSRSAQTPPSPSLSPSRFTVSGDSSNSGLGINPSNPIQIPRGSNINHQRTQSNSSIQSSASSSLRRSQVIIPPPVSVSSLQFASFSSLTSSGPNSKRSTPNSSNIRNLSIQIVDKDKCETALDSQDNQVFYLETPTLHPLDVDGSDSNYTEIQLAHQTMNRVHPNQDSTESLDLNSLTTCNTSTSSVSSMSSSLGTYGNNQMNNGFDRSSSGAGYFRQRSLSAANLDSHPGSQRQPSQDSATIPHHGTWGERSARRTHGSVPSSNQNTEAIPIKRLSESKSGSTLSSSSYSGEISDIVIKKSATGRMFTVERTIPVSPTKCSRFIVGAPAPTSTPPPRSPSPFQNQNNVITRM